MYQFNHLSLTITSFYLRNYGQLGDFILVGGLLASFKQNFVQLRHMIATITDTSLLHGVFQLMWKKHNPYYLRYDYAHFFNECTAHVIEVLLIAL